MDETLLRHKVREAIRNLCGTRLPYWEVTQAGPDPRRDTQERREKMNTTQVHQAHGTIPARVPFLSTCPKCKHNQAQWYTRGALLRLLNGNHPVEGYCVTCDEYWGISTHERAELAVALGWTRAFHGRS
jgi:hypothetical protein